MDHDDEKCFNTVTQYDNKFNEIWLTNLEAKKGLACPYFSILTIYNFLNGGKIDKKTHEKNIEASINYATLVGTNEEMNFRELITGTNLDPSEIMCTATDLVRSGELGFDVMIPEKPLDAKRKAVMFLKNARFFAILIDKNGYYLRDCHEAFQYNYNGVDELIRDLNKNYQFSDPINIGGVLYDHYSSIEFIKIEKPFKTDIVEIVCIDSCTSKELYALEIEEKESGYIELDDSIPKYVSDGDGSIFGTDNKSENKIEISHEKTGDQKVSSTVTTVTIDGTDFVFFE